MFRWGATGQWSTRWCRKYTRVLSRLDSVDVGCLWTSSSDCGGELWVLICLILNMRYTVTAIVPLEVFSNNVFWFALMLRKGATGQWSQHQLCRPKGLDSLDVCCLWGSQQCSGGVDQQRYKQQNLRDPRADILYPCTTTSSSIHNRKIFMMIDIKVENYEVTFPFRFRNCWKKFWVGVVGSKSCAELHERFWIWLCTSGASLNVRSHRGKTALGLAESEGHKKTAGLLRRAGKCSSSIGNQRATNFSSTSKSSWKKRMIITELLVRSMGWNKMIIWLNSFILWWEGAPNWLDPFL